jgi:hypothetical protein
MSALCQKRTLLAAPSRISGFAIITLPSAGKVYWVFALAALSPISPLIANAMKHPSRSDFHTVVTAAGVTVTFKPTNSTYSFFRFAETGALSLAGIQHAGRDTDDYPSDEVQDMALQIASGHASVHFGPFQDEEVGETSPRKQSASRNEPLSPKVSGPQPFQIRRTRAPPICACWSRSKNGWRSFAKSIASS